MTTIYLRQGHKFEPGFSAKVFYMNAGDKIKMGDVVAIIDTATLGEGECIGFGRVLTVGENEYTILPSARKYNPPYLPK
jgi:hypothetical protein